ncbi:MAG: hypothetical protein J6571_03735 [Snodgrassella sp.]|uniref:hypothetical protein n=1 Tax=Snodgrassella TaxID=1193515 RepID=UPI001EF51388|nr:MULTISPECIES: hypothetical protein [Snodgrassella]MCO6518819.1 hypothetical protein [Snodgrassella sp.]MCO6522280.1 hypothetical protein [Snodgrassella sp.]MCO6526002.1 hypothetical protein [Snodgrassella sp.]
MKKLIIIYIVTSLLFIAFINIGFLLYRNEHQLSAYSTTCFIISFIIAIAELPLTIKIAKMRQNKEQTPDSTTDFTSLGKK